MPPKVEAKICRMMVRTESGNREQCGVKYKGSKCPEPDPHLTVLKTGYCSNRWCEGTKAKTWRGAPAPTCQFWETCPCECHDAVSKMFAMSEMERISVDNSGYIADRGGFWMPTAEDRAQWAAERASLSNGGATDTPIVIESPAPGLVPASMARTFRPTATGRAARGELESQVNAICGTWLVEKYPWPCTPLYISEQIAKTEGIKAPSTGAITAVFERWSKLGYAVIDKKPLRFSRYTEDGIRLGLDVMKANAKRNREQARSLQSRGIR